MATVVAATITALGMIRGCENDQTMVKIKVAGPDLRPGDPTLLGVVKFHDALATDAGVPAQFQRDAIDQFIGNANRGAPAGTSGGDG